MLQDGVEWRLRWFVLDATPARAAQIAAAEGRAVHGARLTSTDDDDEATEAEIRLEHVSAVKVVPRKTDAGVVHANFHLATPRKVLHEFAARSEAEAREWVRALETALFDEKLQGTAARAARI